ncbi:class I SAM-dependent methyltransferase [Hydrogenophaga sp. 5NK40-0174]|uniref:class I SAM-dependent methyltransferase n=1 Tax=Hydrogenophaga sp. 5NK40-0174 TaxID=3127649 RepID=UPI003341FC0B
MRSHCLDILQAHEGERVLDVGCGPAYYLNDLPRLDYYGFDTDERYIDHAKRRFGERGHFFAEPFDESRARELGPFDGVLLMGLLHHLDDQSCHSLLGAIAASLRPGGRVVALDTVIHEGQHRFEHWLAVHDRGEFVRTPEAFLDLAKPHFESVQGQLPKASLTPSIYWVMTMRKPIAVSDEPATP